MDIATPRVTITAFQPAAGPTSAASNKIKLEEINRKSYGDDFQDDGLDVSSDGNISNSEARSPPKKLRQRGAEGETRGGTQLMGSSKNKKRESVITPRSSLP